MTPPGAPIDDGERLARLRLARSSGIGPITLFDAEQMNSRGFGVEYGSRRVTGRFQSCSASATPPVIAPP